MAFPKLVHVVSSGMDLAQDIDALYARAAQHLHTADNPKLEALRLRIAAGEMSGVAINLSTLSKVLDASADETNHHFADLRSGGFVEHHFNHFTWMPSDPVARARILGDIGAIEANVALRCRYLDMTPIMPALRAIADQIADLAIQDRKLEVCLATQRLFLALVASVNSPDLFREYAMIAKAAATYAWSAAQGKGASAEINDRMQNLVDDLNAGDGMSAARGATYLRSMSEKTVLAVPLSC